MKKSISLVTILFLSSVFVFSQEKDDVSAPDSVSEDVVDMRTAATSERSHGHKPGISDVPE